jgi:tryptophanyl-tRNA synthetase
MFIQSSVPEHAELQLLLSMVTPLGWLERVPTYKEALDNVKDKDLHTYGFLGYPILQTADIVIYGDQGKDLLVPVGEDQVSHVELSREIVHRFNTYYGLEMDLAPLVQGPLAAEFVNLVGYHHPGEGIDNKNPEYLAAYRRNIRALALTYGISNFLEKLGNGMVRNKFTYIPKLIEPSALLTKTPRIPGTDGRKMSKSYGNFISLSESDDSIRTKSRAMITDPARKRRTDPGNPDVCPVYDWHKLFSPPETLKWSAEGCRSAGIGCIECKMAMADNLIKWIAPVRAGREEYAAHPDEVLRILDEGSEKAREVAQKTIGRVREAVFNWKEKRAEVNAPRAASQAD